MEKILPDHDQFTSFIATHDDESHTGNNQHNQHETMRDRSAASQTLIENVPLDPTTGTETKGARACSSVLSKGDYTGPDDMVLNLTFIHRWCHGMITGTACCALILHCRRQMSRLGGAVVSRLLSARPFMRDVSCCDKALWLRVLYYPGVSSEWLVLLG